MIADYADCAARPEGRKNLGCFDPQITQIGRFHGETMERDPRTFAIIGAAMGVHGVLGPGFLEAVYHEALAREMTKRAVPFRSEVELPVFYKGERLSASYRCDFVCYDTVIVEVKALTHVTGLERRRR